MHYINALLRTNVNNCITLGIIYETNRIIYVESIATVACLFMKLN